MKKLLLYHHLGLGDCIECSGMVRFYAKKYDRVDVFSKNKYYNLSRYLYRDDKKIFVNKLEDDLEYKQAGDFINNYGGEILVVGFSNYFQNIKYFENKDFSCTEAFYELANLTYNKKYEYFHLERDEEEESRIYEKLNPQNKKYIFVHDDPLRGFLIDIKTDLEIIKNDPSENIFHMIKILENAEEIHCMPSSFLCLIDCLGHKIDFKNLFLHKNIRNVFIGKNTLLKKWSFI